MTRTSSSLLLLSLLTLLASCGGGSSDSASPPPPAPSPPAPPPVIDTTRPTVTSRSPDAGATVDPGLSVVTIGFSEAVSLQSNSIAEVRSGSISGPVVATTPSILATQLLLTSATPFPNGSYLVRVDGFRDASGNVMEGEVSWEFSVRPPQDLTPPTIVGRSPAPGASATPGAVITVTFSEPLATRPPVIELRAGSASGALHPGSLTANSDRTVWTLTPDTVLAAGVEYFVRVSEAIDDSGNTSVPEDWSFSLPAAGFSLVTEDLRNRNSQLLFINAFQLALTLDSARNPLLLFSEDTGASTRRAAQVIRLTDGGAAAPTVERLPLLTTTASIAEQSIRVAPDGSTLVAWVQSDESNLCTVSIFAPQLHVARFANGAWTPVGPAANSSFCSSPVDMALAVDSAGNPVVSSGEFNPSNVRIPRVRRFAAGAWSDLGTGLALRTPGTSGVIATDLIAVPGSGRFLVAWIENNSGTFRSYVAAWQDSGNWSDVGGVVATHTGGSNETTLRLAVSSTGTPFVLLRREDSLEVRRFDGSDWLQVGPVLRNAANMQPSNYSLTLVNDNPVVAWTDNANLVSLAARFDAAAAGWVQTTIRANTADLTDLMHDPVANRYWIAKRTDGFRSAVRVSRAELLP
jgi:hypothetical protein